MSWQNDSTQLLVNFGLAGTMLGEVVRLLTHVHIAVLIGALGGLLAAFLVAGIRGEQF